MSRTRASRRTRSPRRAAAVATCTLVAVVSATGVASAAPVVDEEVRQSTFRLDGDNGLLIFANKSRADLCTDERLAFEADLEEWLNNGAVGDPPEQPASSNEGVEDVTFTTRQVDARTITTVDGPGLPVEVWRLDGEEGGIDCTATDGTGAGLFATGTMDFTSRQVQAATGFSNDVRLRGMVEGTDGVTYSYEVRYVFKDSAGQGSVFQPLTRLVPLG
jgi:hypothetical protein